VRETRLTGWDEATMWARLGGAALLPETAEPQRVAAAALRKAQAAVARQVIVGIGEAIGLLAYPNADGRGVTVELPPEADPAHVARAVVAENVTAWVEADAGRDRVTVAVAPWYAAEEIDHTVLVVAKVAHVLLGIHPPTMDLQAHDAACGWHAPGAAAAPGKTART
jgi:hypothetical protein